MPLNVVFAGSSDFAIPTLEALRESGHGVLGVLTQPNRPAGRRRKLTPTPVRQSADAAGLEVLTPGTLRDPAAVERLRRLAPDVMVVVDYGLMIPATLLHLPRLGCINGHASLLPRWRGAAPIERAILAGDTRTGISVMQMDEGLDTGGVLLTREIDIAETDTAGALRKRLADICASVLVEALAGLEAGTLAAAPQPEEGACYARKLESGEARIDWRQPAGALRRQINAFNPRPGAWTTYRGLRMKLLGAEPGSPGAGEPGEVVGAGRAGIEVMTGEGCLRLLVLQLPGKLPVSAAEFLNGHEILGDRLGREDQPI